ncbi:concanavalin A-like lectin/glucanase domain-containing protein [Immersiella caudata]|uniref:Concanavalin A-like lectin/glucanase domain-containing protein n=1 Tax=Immersiella caudata TaxID=314043 RepID=A0AA40C3Z1_9PEZI|nr:concanavalin A-like lectin/glucanase domain-containing protein [Immersiella caudata]
MHSSKSALLAALASLAATAQGRLLIHLPLNETSGTRANDWSGSNLHGTYVNGPQLQGSNGARLDGVNDYIQLPNNILRNLGSLTASIEVNIRPEQTGQYFVYGLGNTARETGFGYGYLFATGDPQLRVGITPTHWDFEAEVRTNRPLPRNIWKTITFTIEAANGGRLGLYDDGRYIAGRTNTLPITAPGLINSGATVNNYIGRSVFQLDKYLAGSVRNFRLYDNVLSANEIAALHRPQTQPTQPTQPTNPTQPRPEDRVTTALTSISIPNSDNIRGNINLPATSNGLAIRWETSDSSVVRVNGLVTRPVGRDATVVLTARVSTDGLLLPLLG